jgi:dihydrofolate reductase
MGKVVTGFSMSLDGFVAGPNDGPQLPLGEGGERLFRWYSGGDTPFRVPGGQFTFMVSRASADRLGEAMGRAGALVTGRRTFDITSGWNGRHPLGVPVFLVTHTAQTIPREWLQQWETGGSSLTVVTDGPESALRQAQAAAGGKDVLAGSPSIAQQWLAAGLMDEVAVDLVPFLLGGGVRLFDRVGSRPIDMRIASVTEGTGVTHIQYGIAK